MLEIGNKIYARPLYGKVEHFFSSVFETPKPDDILVEQGKEDYHAHVQLKYTALDRNGCHNYKLENGTLAPTTVEEKAAELAARPLPPPSLEERLTALEAVQLEEILGGTV